MDVYETVAVLEEEDGLLGFWQSDVNHQRLINLFEFIGATTLVDSPQRKPLVPDPPGGPTRLQ
ncbi:MAG: hypothetical protein QM755_16350 [Luteolibacter sp.]